MDNNRNKNAIAVLIRRLAEVIDFYTDKTRGRPLEKSIEFIANATGYSPDTVIKWRQGKIFIKPETLVTIAKLGKEEAKLDREWGKLLFEFVYKNTNNMDVTFFLNQIWGSILQRRIIHNLPVKQHNVLVGRKEELEKLFKYLSEKYAIHRIEVSGVGGVGKTALVLECAHKCLMASENNIIGQVPIFDAIIFVSAKQQELKQYGIKRLIKSQKTLDEICREISRVLPVQVWTNTEEQIRNTYDALSKQKTLLIVDNLETIDDVGEVLAFLDQVPLGVKIITTTRNSIYSQISILNLGEKEGFELIQNEVMKHDGLQISAEITNIIFEKTGGVPAAIIYAIGQWSCYKNMEILQRKISDPGGDISLFCFKESVEPLKQLNNPAYRVLLTTALFPKRPLQEAVLDVSDLDYLLGLEGIKTLRQLSLINDIQEENQPLRLSLLPLTREYALAELSRDNEIETILRSKWIKWYLQFAEQNGGYDWENCQIQFDPIYQEWENFEAVLTWCASRNYFDIVDKFWHDERLGRVSVIYGCWDDRLRWNEWIRNEAEARGNWEVALTAMSEIINSSIWLGRKDLLEKSLEYYKYGWNLQKHFNRTKLAIFLDNGVLLNARIGKITEAKRLLELEIEYIDALDLDEREKRRLLLPPRYYHPGALYFRNRDLERAKILFIEMDREAQYLSWQRMVIHAKNWLADISIAEQQFEQAKILLEEGFPVAKRNNDRRRIACFERSYSFYYQGVGDNKKSKEYAKESLIKFQTLGMQPEIQQMLSFLDNNPNRKLEEYVFFPVLGLL